MKTSRNLHLATIKLSISEMYLAGYAAVNVNTNERAQRKEKNLCWDIISCSTARTTGHVCKK